MSTPKDEKHPLDPENAQELLPWYLTGTTSHAENEVVEGMLKGSADLREQLDSAREQRQAVTEGGDALGGPAPGNLTGLLQRIETTRRRRHVVTNEPGLLGRWVLQLALVAACALVIAQAALLYQLGQLPFQSAGHPAGQSTGKNYATAAGETTLPAPAASLIVSFRPEVTAAQLARMLNEIDATMIDGPQPGLTFILALNDSTSTDSAIAKLHSRPDLVASVQQR